MKNAILAGAVSIALSLSCTWEIFAGEAKVAAGLAHTLLVKPDGTLWAWGINSDGRLGLGDINNRNAPVKIGANDNWDLVSAGYGHSVAITTTGAAWSFGGNSDGQLGLGDTVIRLIPTQIGTSAWKVVSAGYVFSVGISTNGTMWSWGRNGNGQLGLSDTLNRSVPTKIGTETIWDMVAAGGNHTLAIRTDGTMWSWGDNASGQLGLGDAAPRYTPVRVGTGSGWAQISSGYNFSLAISTNGTLWSWGNNDYGQLGLGGGGNQNLPIKIGADTNWSFVSAGVEHVIAIKTDGTLWTWGKNDFGQLGLGDTTNRSSPVQVGTGTTWKSCSAAKYYYSAATKTDDSVWVWGRNEYGQLGTGNYTDFQSPVRRNAIPMLTWSNESGYATDGIEPNFGTPSDTFVFRVKFSDADNEAPGAGHPLLHIKKAGSEISGSPFVMSYVSGAYSSGAIYSYSKTLAATGSDYTYYFEAQDAYGAVATGTPLTPVAGPSVSNHAPALAWSGEANYISDGLNPQAGDRNASFVFRVKYSDADNQAPNAGYPKVHIKQGGAEISGSPFGMSYVSGAYTTGAIYSYSGTLTPGTDYRYYFEAQDSDGVEAAGSPVTEVDAPDVSNQSPAIAWTGETNYSAAGLYPLKGQATDNYVFRVKYSDADSDAPAAGYPKVHIKKAGLPISGSPFVLGYVSGTNNTGAIYSLSKTLAGGDYTYYFDALDAYNAQAGGSPASEQSGPVVIGAALPPAQEVKVYHGVFKPGLDEKTNISFNTSSPAAITVTVYNNLGHKIKELWRGTSSSGLNLIQWDGRDAGGAKVASGVYTIKIEGGGINQSKRVVVVR